MPSEAISFECLICLSDSSLIKTIPKSRTVVYVGMSSIETHFPSTFSTLRRSCGNRIVQRNLRKYALNLFINLPSAYTNMNESGTKVRIGL